MYQHLLIQILGTNGNFLSFLFGIVYFGVNFFVIILQIDLFIMDYDFIILKYIKYIFLSIILLYQ